MDSPQYFTIKTQLDVLEVVSFKPYYKWIVLNTLATTTKYDILDVLNLIINGQSSILRLENFKASTAWRFKPYYKWIVLNTELVWHTARLE